MLNTELPTAFAEHVADKYRVPTQFATHENFEVGRRLLQFRPTDCTPGCTLKASNICDLGKQLNTAPEPESVVAMVKRMMPGPLLDREGQLPNE